MDEPKQHRAELEGRITTRTSMRAELLVVSIGELASTLKANPAEIFVKAPTWWPRALLFLFGFIVIIHLAVGPTMIAWKGFTRGYNVELCPKITYKGIELSNCVKLTRPIPR